MDAPLKAAWPWPGGKADIAAEVWKRFGDVPNFVDAFCGTAIVTLLRPHDLDGKTETLNDLDGFITNALRAITYAPEETAEWCDSPVNEIDLTAWHLHLKAAREDLTTRLFADPFYCDPMLAGVWLWGIASWIGDGWCVADGPWINVDGRLVDRRTIGADVEGTPLQAPNLTPGPYGTPTARGIQRYRNAPGVPKKMPEIGKSPNGQIGVNRKGIQALRYREGVPKQMPVVSKPSAGANCIGGVQSPRLAPPGALLTYFARLSDRLRRARFLCGDWRRAVKDSVTVNHGLTGVLLDPPYPQAEHDMRYHEVDVTITPLDGQDVPDAATLAEMTQKALAIYAAEEAEKRRAVEVWYQAAQWPSSTVTIPACGSRSAGTGAKPRTRSSRQPGHATAGRRAAGTAIRKPTDAGARTPNASAAGSARIVSIPRRTGAVRCSRNSRLKPSPPGRSQSTRRDTTRQSSRPEHDRPPRPGRFSERRRLRAVIWRDAPRA